MAAAWSVPCHADPSHAIPPGAVPELFKIKAGVWNKILYYFITNTYNSANKKKMPKNPQQSLSPQPLCCCAGCTHLFTTLPVGTFCLT